MEVKVSTLKTTNKNLELDQETLVEIVRKWSTTYGFEKPDVEFDYRYGEVEATITETSIEALD